MLSGFHIRRARIWWFAGQLAAMGVTALAAVFHYVWVGPKEPEEHHAPDNPAAPRPK